MNSKQKTNKFMLLWYSHPRAAIALVLTLVNLLVIMLFTILLSIVSGNPFFDELSYLFTYTMCSDGIYDFVDNQEDVTCFVIKIILTVIQMVIFSGALIGFTTDILQSTIDKRLRNVGKLNLKNHYVLLNWSAIGPNLIYDLSFLDGEKTIVILCEDDRDEVLTSIENIFTENGDKMKDIKLFIKNGSSSSLKHLTDVSIDKAKYIGVLLKDAEESGEHNISNKDLASFKTLMAILHMGTNSNIVIEVETSETVSKIERFIKETDESLLNRVSVFAHNSVIGHILGRAVINPVYSHLFHQVLSYDGCEFYGIQPMDMEEALYIYNDCIPVVNYDDDSFVDESGNKAVDQLYILAEDNKTLGKRKTPKSYVKPLEYRENIERDDFTLIIFSDSDRASFVIEEIKTYNSLYGKEIRYEVHSFNEDINDVVSQIENTEGSKKILLLSNEGGNQEDQDADVFISLLSLKINGKLNKNIPLFAEIVNPKNLISMQNLGVVSVIVSNKIISLFMVQLLTHPGSRRFYRDIVVANGENENGNVDFDIVKAKEVLAFSEENLTFSCKSEFVHSFFMASNKTKMCIGVKYANKDNSDITFLCSKMDEENQLVICPDDELILITY